MNSKTLIISSELPASTDEIWERLQKLETLQYIAKPYVDFKLLSDPEAFGKEGCTSTFKLKVFGFLPMGIHTTKVLQLSKDELSIYTNEGNKAIPVWNHRITLKRIDEHLTHYTDEVEISAGWKTPFIHLWSKAFYKHRQRKWILLLRS